ncbi:MAG TPA: hypothetical protein VHL78_00435 [Actinomycetota bacterium]|nr:hypothetical protein [Actinomycetota bacterium]
MFRWRYLDASGAEVGASEAFADRGAAEEWLGGSWAELLARGVECVALLEGDREVYRMGLREE